MRVLFICDNYYPLEGAAANCTYKILCEMKKNKIECGVVNITNNFTLPSIINIDDYTIIQTYVAGDVGVRTEVFSKLILSKKIECIIEKIKAKILKNPIQSRKAKLIYETLCKYGEEYDVIIPVIANFNNGLACMNYCDKKRKPFILYQVDPIGTNEMYNNKREYLCKFEKKLYEKAESVMTTPIIINEKNADEFYKNTNMISTQFPNVRDLVCSKKKNTNKIVCFFCGYIYSGIRDCRYTLDLFSRIDDKDLCIEFAGEGQEDVIGKYAENKLKNRINHIGKVHMNDAIIRMQEADFLINIGNTMSNQVPSKLFDYISTGNPIINICKNENCPTIPYLEKYNNAINLIESKDENVKKSQAEELYKFIQKHLGVKCQYSEIDKIFKENTSQYVAKQFITELNKINLQFKTRKDVN